MNGKVSSASFCIAFVIKNGNKKTIAKTCDDDKAGKNYDEDFKIRRYNLSKPRLWVRQKLLMKLKNFKFQGNPVRIYVVMYIFHCNENKTH